MRNLLMMAVLCVTTCLGAGCNSTAISGPTPAASKDEVASRIREAIDKLGNTNLVERSNAASVLRQFGERSVPDLLRTAKTGTGVKRSKAIFILGQIGEPDVCPAFEEFLKQQGPALPSLDRAVIVDALGEIGGTNYVSLFKAMLISETNDDVRFACAYRLSKFGDKSGIEYLTQHWLSVLEAGPEQRRTLAAYSLKKIHGQDFGTDTRRWRDWIKENEDKTKPLAPYR